MVLINGVKYACERCIRGHRVTSCTHADQPLVLIKPKGRPSSACEFCKESRKGKNYHPSGACVCGGQKKQEEKKELARMERRREKERKMSLRNQCTCEISGDCKCHKTRKTSSVTSNMRKLKGRKKHANDKSSSSYRSEDLNFDDSASLISSINDIDIPSDMLSFLDSSDIKRTNSISSSVNHNGIFKKTDFYKSSHAFNSSSMLSLDQHSVYSHSSMLSPSLDVLSVHPTDNNNGSLIGTPVLQHGFSHSVHHPHSLKSHGHYASSLNHSLHGGKQSSFISLQNINQNAQSANIQNSNFQYLDNGMSNNNDKSNLGAYANSLAMDSNLLINNAEGQANWLDATLLKQPQLEHGIHTSDVNNPNNVNENINNQDTESILSTMLSGPISTDIYGSQQIFSNDDIEDQYRVFNKTNDGDISNKGDLNGSSGLFSHELDPLKLTENSLDKLALGASNNNLNDQIYNMSIGDKNQQFTKGAQKEHVVLDSGNIDYTQWPFEDGSTPGSVVHSLVPGANGLLDFISPTINSQQSSPTHEIQDSVKTPSTMLQKSFLPATQGAHVSPQLKGQMKFSKPKSPPVTSAVKNNHKHNYNIHNHTRNSPVVVQRSNSMASNLSYNSFSNQDINQQSQVLKPHTHPRNQTKNGISPSYSGNIKGGNNSNNNNNFLIHQATHENNGNVEVLSLTPSFVDFPSNFGLAISTPYGLSTGIESNSNTKKLIDSNMEHLLEPSGQHTQTNTGTLPNQDTQQQDILSNFSPKDFDVELSDDVKALESIISSNNV